MLKSPNISQNILRSHIKFASWNFTFLTPGGGIVNAAAWSWVERIECRAITLYLKVKIIVLSKSFSLEDTAKNNKIYLQIAIKNFFIMKNFKHKSSENDIMKPHILIKEKILHINLYGI